VPLDQITVHPIAIYWMMRTQITTVIAPVLATAIPITTITTTEVTADDIIKAGNFPGLWPGFGLKNPKLIKKPQNILFNIKSPIWLHKIFSLAK